MAMLNNQRVNTPIIRDPEMNNDFTIHDMLGLDHWFATLRRLQAWWIQQLCGFVAKIRVYEFDR